MRRLATTSPRPNHFRRRSLFLERLEERSLLTAGMLDPTFGVGGKVITDFGLGASESIHAAAADSDGKLVVIVSSNPSSEPDFKVARFNPNGTLDSTFGNNGRVTTDFGGADYASSLVVTSEGKILVGGRSDANLAMARYNADGSLDNSFGDGGRRVVNYFAGESVAAKVQPDESILVYGEIHISGHFPHTGFFVGRVTSEGLLDTAFGSGGMQQIDFGSNTRVTALAVQPDGSLLLAGTSVFAAGINLARLTPTGQLDTTFGQAGKQTGQFIVSLQHGSKVSAIALQPDGAFIVAGEATAIAHGATTKFGIARYTSSGQLDTSFGTGGRQSVEFHGGGASASVVALQSDGTILVGGSVSDGRAGTDFGIAHLSSSGQLDTSFGNGGKTTTDFGSYSEFVNTAVVLSHGDIVLAGRSGNLTTDAVLVRYQGSQRTATTTTLASSNNLIHSNDIVTFTATVSGGASTPSGSVTFYDGDVELGTESLVAGTAQLVTSALTDGLFREITAVYRGNSISGYSSSATSVLTQTVVTDQTDLDFGDNGIVSLNNVVGAPLSMAVSPSSQIIVLGSSYVAAFRSDGSLDTDFGTDGRQYLGIQTKGIVVGPDGSMIVYGTTYDDGGFTSPFNPNYDYSQGSDFALIRLTPDGQFDPSFGSAGMQTIDFGEFYQGYYDPDSYNTTYDSLTAVFVDPDGSIMAFGNSSADYRYFGYFRVVASLTPDGQLDYSFGYDGKDIDFGGGPAIPSVNIAQQADGKTVVVGGLNGDFSITRTNSDNSPDDTFGVNGSQFINLGGYDNAMCVAIQPNGKIVVAGYSSEYGFAMIRLLGITDIDNDGIDGAVDTQATTFSNDFGDGVTSGSITGRGDQILTIMDAADPYGVVVAADPLGGATPATVTVEGGAAVLTVSAGDSVVVTHGSVILDVLAGTVEATFVAESGQVATTTLGSGTGLTFQPESFTFIAPESNTQTVEVLVNGTQVDISPGQTVVGTRVVTVDIRPESLNVDSNGTLTVVIFGAVDFNAAQIDVGTVQFAGAAAWQSSLVDANGDGRLDLQLKFRRQDTILDEIYAQLLVDDLDADGVLDSTHQEAQVAVTGETLDDALFSGSDNINLFLAGRSLRNLLDELFG